MRPGLGLALVVAALCAAPASAAEVQTWTVPSAFVNPAKAQFNRSDLHELRVDVALPDGYDGHRRFPVLWLLHGHGDDYDSWLKPTDGNLLNTAKGLGAIVVMPEGAQGWYTDWYSGGARGGDGRGWERYFFEELMPLAERRLLIAPGRTNHAIAGLSMGGEGAMYLATQRPGTFGAVASFSGPLHLGRTEWPTAFGTQGQTYTDVFGDASGAYSVGHDPTALLANLSRTRVFVEVGDGVPEPTRTTELTNTFGALAELELRQHADDFVAAARGAGVDVTYVPRQGIHDWPYWRAALVNAIGWGLFKPVAEHARRWTVRTVRQTGQAWDAGYAFDQAPTVVEALRRDGDTLSVAGSGRVRITIPREPAFTAQAPFSRRIRAWRFR